MCFVDDVLKCGSEDWVECPATQTLQQTDSGDNQLSRQEPKVDWAFM